MNATTIKKGNREYRFVFDPQTDDPTEGVTLTGIFEDGQRIRPSSVPDSEIPYAEAGRELIKS